jgi:DNA-binding MarR family transcriptional regulator
MTAVPVKSRLTIQQEIKQSKPFATKSQEAHVALLRTADDSKRYLGDRLEPAGLTVQQYNVLRILRGAGAAGLPTLTVADRMVERTPGVTRLIDRMEKKGWVRRRRCTEDRRRVWCEVTREGLNLLDRLDGAIEAVDDAVASVLEPHEIEQLVEYLDRLRAGMNTTAGDE